jgi:hypothetical protein
MPVVGFEHTTPVFERAKTVLVFDRAASVIGVGHNAQCKYIISFTI